MPSAEIVIDLVDPDVVPLPFCAPLVWEKIDCTALPPTLSAALTVTVTEVLFQPFAFGACESVCVEVGAVVSSNATVSMAHVFDEVHERPFDAVATIVVCPAAFACALPLPSTPAIDGDVLCH